MGVYIFFFQAEDGIRDLVRSRGLGDVYKRRQLQREACRTHNMMMVFVLHLMTLFIKTKTMVPQSCLLYTSDAADERSSVDLGGRRIIKKKNMRTS